MGDPEQAAPSRPGARWRRVEEGLAAIRDPELGEQRVAGEVAVLEGLAAAQGGNVPRFMAEAIERARATRARAQGAST